MMNILEKIYQRLMQVPAISRVCSLPVLRRFCTYEALTYIFFGVLTTFVNWASYLVIKRILGQSTAFANAAAWVIAVLFAYVVNKKYVFKSRQNSFGGLAREFALFIAARLLSFAFDQAFMIVTVDYLHFPDALAKILSNIFVMIMNFFASKIVIFRKKPSQRQD
jgi:putative flippase GtrA